MDEAVTHYINSHPSDEAVHVDVNNLALNVQEDAGGRVAIMHSQTYSTSMCRQVSVVGDHVTEGQWSEELLDTDSRLAVIMAHITAQSRQPLHSTHHKVQTVRTDVDTSVILDNSIRLFNGQTLDETTLVTDADGLELAGASPIHNKHSKKSLPHKKRISRKLKKNSGNSPPQQVEMANDIVVISCADDGHHEEILPDNFVTAVQHQSHLSDDTHHITHEVQMRPILICQLCGDFYGEDQLKFFHHLKQHYEPHIIIENPVADLGIDKMTNSCIVDNTAQLPDAIVELSLENSVPKTIYQPIDKHVLYTTNEKPLVFANNRVQYSMASMDKEPTVVGEVEKTDLYDTLDKFELFSCGKCNKSFRKQKQYEMHVKEAHSNTKVNLQLCDMGEFSEPEDLMEGIHVAVEEPSHYEHSLLPHLTVENGHAHQHGPRHWNGRGGWTYCGCGSRERQDPQHLKVFKEEVFRILETDVASDSGSFPDSMLPAALPPAHAPLLAHAHAHDAHEAHDAHDTQEAHDADTHDTQESEASEVPETKPVVTPTGKTKEAKRLECQSCHRVFYHRNSLFYHMLSHNGKQKVCRDCGKAFYTTAALKIHRRVHNGDRPYKCDECGREFRQWNDLKNHKVSIHTNQKMFKCEFCNKEFARKYSLNVHRRIHTGEKNYKCEYCHMTFRTSSYRLNHMRTHTGDRPHRCATCDKAFRVAADLRRHALTHDKLRQRAARPRPRPAQDDSDSKDKKVLKITIEVPPKPVKKIAVASTTKTAIQKPDKKPSPKSTTKKTQSAKKGAPNVTVDQLDKSYTDNVEVFESRQEQFGKFKEVYDGNYSKEDLENFGKQIIGYKDEQPDERDFAILRPMFRNHVLCDSETDKTVFRNENTDGKMEVFTHIEKASNTVVPPPQISINDMRHLERDVRTEINTEGENGFLERLTALYNIPAV